MDKKNTTIGVALLLAAFAVIYFAPRPAPPPFVPKTERAEATTPGASSPAAGALPGTRGTTPSSTATTPANLPAPAIATLGNDFIEASFTEAGGALLHVAFIKRDEKGRRIYPQPPQVTRPRPAVPDSPFVFNEASEDPILAFVESPETLPGLHRNLRFEQVSQSTTEIVYRAVLDNRIEITRRYIIPPNRSDDTDPYQIRHEATFRNLTGETVNPMRVSLSLGTAAPNNKNDDGLQLKTGFSSGSDQEFISRAELESGSGFLGIGAHGSKPYIVSSGPHAWTAVKNQFFTSILTGDTPAAALVTSRVRIDQKDDESLNAYGISGAAQFDVAAIPANGETKLAGNIYVGPKEYRRLANSKVFKADQDKIMDFGFFKYFSQILLTLMTWIHGWTNNWGMAIILTTLTLKTIFIPFTLAASKSAKRMAKLQPELQIIREKFKDNPQKQQAATMELFKSRRINPVGGCLPILITIPFFMGFFTMLQSAAELRFAPFLWAWDLSSQDTIAMLFGVVPLNIMPILMGATMIAQMHLTPSPSVDNMQMKMMKFMPYIFTIFCYTFSCALSLYSFVNGLFTIGQQLVINRMKEPADLPAKAAPSGKPLKNVTPSRKKLK
jgi:YidC/Oxa1 family membrane protein insertase